MSLGIADQIHLAHDNKRNWIVSLHVYRRIVIDVTKAAVEECQSGSSGVPGGCSLPCISSLESAMLRSRG